MTTPPGQQARDASGRSDGDTIEARHGTGIVGGQLGPYRDGREW